ncbi:alpha/beta hydrolase family protein [Limnoglobus roseus]|uniref:Abhydrolase domain-containing 18 n=1 Tax=Limnoglobus roseus TaxID=2598579 RepID=A0A5C1AA44_9BACT|nr:prolyl oligopeptidase family serine peptidase [Limnoglobus roseus]QEL13918.1 abhydrolase domain-containing 18 [Limnoglobus roseus]
MRPLLALFASLTLSAIATAEEPIARGTVEYVPPVGDESVSERFRLPKHTFECEFQLKYDLPMSGVTVSTLRFPSPVVTPHPENNTVHCEYFAPTGKTNIPAVLVLDILDGAQVVSRGEAMWLAQNGVGALVVQMAYYGPRRPTKEKVRLLSVDIEHSVKAVTQTVLDCRRATAWLAARPEVNAKKLGIVGTSLGSFVGGVTAAAEPRLTSACLLLGGGDLVDAFYNHPKAAPFRKVNELFGGSKDALKKLIDPIDPITYAAQLKRKDFHLLLIAASRDDVVPPAAMKRLWEATGQPKILWLDATHVGAAAYVFPVMKAVIQHMKDE